MKKVLKDIEVLYNEADSNTLSDRDFNKFEELIERYEKIDPVY